MGQMATSPDPSTATHSPDARPARFIPQQRRAQRKGRGRGREGQGWVDRHKWSTPGPRPGRSRRRQFACVRPWMVLPQDGSFLVLPLHTPRASPEILATFCNLGPHCPQRHCSLCGLWGPVPGLTPRRAASHPRRPRQTRQRAGWPPLPGWPFPPAAAPQPPQPPKKQSGGYSTEGTCSQVAAPAHIRQKGVRHGAKPVR